MLAPDKADAAGDHDRLVVTAQFLAVSRGHLLLVGAEVTAGIRTPELVVERGRADRTLEHNFQRRRDSPRFTVILFPGLLEAGNFQVRHRKTAQASLRLGADAGGALVANLAARTRGRARKGGNRGRVVMGFNLHQDIELCILVSVFRRIGRRCQPARGKALDHGGIVVIGGQDAVAMRGMRVLDHGEQRTVLLTAIDGPAGVKNLVSAMLGVGLGKHHQLDVHRVTPEFGVGRGQVVDFVGRERKTELRVGPFQRAAPLVGGIDLGVRPRLMGFEKRGAIFEAGVHGFDHTIV